MKVVQVINSLMSGGAEKLVVGTTILYVEKGLSVDIILLDGRKTNFFDKLKEKAPNVNVISLGSSTKGMYSPAYIFKLRKYIKQYDLVHVHLFPALYWVSLSASLSGSKTPIIVTEHNSTNRRRASPIFKTLDRLLYKKFKRIVTISGAVHDNLQDHLGSSFKNLQMIHNGIDLKMFSDALPYAKKELDVEETNKVIIQVSSFSAQKDQPTLIRAVKNLPEDVKLLLVGKGGLRQECEVLVQELGIEDRVQFLGVRGDVPRLLKTADVVVLSSHYEGLSLSSVEGMISGRPFVASDVPGLTEVVEHAGILFPDNDHNTLSEEILKLVSDTAHYQQTVASCMERAKKFDIQIMTDNYIELHKSLQ